MQGEIIMENEKEFSKEDFMGIVEEFKKATAIPAIKLIAKRSATALTDSKFGGKPYFPKNMEYPKNKSGMPLRLLAQLNFGELPKLENFPSKGILQFFLSDDDDCWGLNFKDPTKQDDFRVIYHADILSEDELMSDFPEFSGEDFPCIDEFALTAEIEPASMTASDFRFDEIFAPLYEKVTGLDYNDPETYAYDELFELGIYEEFLDKSHRIGGYADFTQTDMRKYKEELKSHTALLLKMDTDYSDTDYHTNKHEIRWGDNGVGNFLITPEDLLALDFTNVLFVWDSP
jgi:uncharacterized protein YwqG